MISRLTGRCVCVCFCVCFCYCWLAAATSAVSDWGPRGEVALQLIQRAQRGLHIFRTHPAVAVQGFQTKVSVDGSGFDLGLLQRLEGFRFENTTRWPYDPGAVKEVWENALIYHNGSVAGSRLTQPTLYVNVHLLNGVVGEEQLARQPHTVLSDNKLDFMLPLAADLLSATNKFEAPPAVPAEPLAEPPAEERRRRRQRRLLLGEVDHDHVATLFALAANFVERSSEEDKEDVEKALGPMQVAATVSLSLWPAGPPKQHFALLKLVTEPVLLAVSPAVWHLAGTERIFILCKNVFHSQNLKARLQSLTRIDRTRVLEDCQISQTIGELAVVVCSLAHAWPSYDSVTLSLSLDDGQHFHGAVGGRFADDESLLGDVARAVFEREDDAAAAWTKGNGDFVAAERVAEAKEDEDPYHYELRDRDGNLFVLAEPAEVHTARPDARLFRDLSVSLLLAMGTGFLATAAAVPDVLGQLVGGMIAMPLGLVHQPVQLASIAQMGSAVLMFRMGFHGSCITRSGAVKKAVAFGVGVSYALWLAIFVAVAWCKGTAPGEAFVMASFISISSTTLCSREFQEGGQRDLEPFTMSVLVGQDVLLSGLLAVAPAVAAHGGGLEFVTALARVLAALGFVGLAAGALLKYLGTATYVPLGALTMCLLSELLGLSLELGAFAAGFAFSFAGDHADIGRGCDALQRVLGGLFFVTVGMAVDAALLADNLPRIAAMLVALSTLKFAVLYATFRLAGCPRSAAARAGLLLAHIGEFSLVLLRKVSALNLIQRKVDLILVGCCGLSVFTAPLGMLALRFATASTRGAKKYHSAAASDIIELPHFAKQAHFVK